MLTIIIYSLAFAWVLKYHVKDKLEAIVFVLKGWKLKKPFTCFTCMSGWSALIGSFCSGYGWQSVLICFVTMAIADIISSLQMRYL